MLSSSSGKRRKYDKLKAEDLRRLEEDIEHKRQQLKEAEATVTQNRSDWRALSPIFPDLVLKIAEAVRRDKKEEEEKLSALLQKSEAERGFRLTLVQEAQVELHRLTEELKVLEDDLKASKDQPVPDKYAQTIVTLGAPSSLCDRKKWWTAQDKEDPAYLCFVPPDAQPRMPLELADDVFSEFIVNAKEGTVDQGDCEFIMQLCTLVGGQLEKEDQMAQEFRQILTEYLGVGYNVTLHSVQCKGTNPFPTDGCVLIEGRMCLLTELRLDPRTTVFQAMQYYAVEVIHLTQTKSKNSLFPCFLIELVGTCIRISGLVFFDKVACQPLTPFLHCYINDFDQSHMNMLSCAMRALRTGLQHLKRNKGSAALMRNKDLPACLCSPMWEFQAKFEGKLMFVMKKKDAEELSVFKFCRRYGVAVHQAWAEQGLAPMLYNAEQRVDGWLVIQMEFLSPEDGWKSVVEWAKTSPNSKQEQLQLFVKAVLSRAHQIINSDGKSFAHGDMRGPNIMVRERAEAFEVKFVDFDWSGEVGTTYYPSFMNMHLNWDEDVGPGKPLYQKHDEYCANALYDFADE